MNLKIKKLTSKAYLSFVTNLSEFCLKSYKYHIFITNKNSKIIFFIINIFDYHCLNLLTNIKK